MLHRSVSLLAVILGLVLAGPTRARAETVLFACSDNCPLSLFEALELELRGHGALLVARLSPSGFSVQAHESDARRVASLVPAAAVVWIEREAPLRVRVFSAKEGIVREAPLASPPEEIDPRVFAAIAGSVTLNAIGAPGHTNSADAQAVASAAPSPALSVNTTQDTNVTPPATKKRARFRRFFVRAGPALGFALVTKGMRADRPPPVALVDEAAAAGQASNSLEAFSEHLADAGYDCDVNTSFGTQQIVSHCRVALKTSGAEFVPGVDLQTGAYLSQRFALGIFLRITPDAGQGSPLNHTLFGLQGEFALTEQRPAGFWANLGVGFGLGRIEVQAGSPHSGLPYATSGPLEAHALVALGYRFLPYFGVYATPTVRVLFPDQLWMLEPTLGVEARL